MNCPYCQTPLRADAAECPACRLTYPRACALLGTLPKLHPVVSDTLHVMSPADHRRIRKRIERLIGRFPQVVFQVVIQTMPEAHPFSLYAFWIFNGSVIGGHNLRGGENHAILLLVDPERREAALMPGYGLEPFLKPGALDHLLEMATPAWEAERWGEGILGVLDGLDHLLESAAVRIEGPTPPDEGF